MKVDGRHTRTIWVEPDGWSIGTIDQTLLPHRFASVRLTTLEDAAHAIKVDAGARRAADRRGGRLRRLPGAQGRRLRRGARARLCELLATRPTAINLKWALDEMMAAVRNRPREERLAAAYRRAAEIADEDVAINRAIGRHGLS